MRGLAREPVQPAALTWLHRIVVWGLLLAMLVQIVTGLLLPWSGGHPLTVFGHEFASPWAKNESLHEVLEGLHEVGGNAFIPLVALHVLGALKHAALDHDGVMARMFRPLRGGQ